MDLKFFRDNIHQDWLVFLSLDPKIHQLFVFLGFYRSIIIFLGKKNDNNNTEGEKLLELTCQYSINRFLIHLN